MADLETVYAIHNFAAENNDEVPFSVGEPIIVLERDEGFNDGWWQGQNVKGEIGLFPKSYTSPDQPSNVRMSLETKIDSLKDAISKMRLPNPRSESPKPPPPPQLPTPSTSTSTKKSREQLPRAGSVSSQGSQPTSSRPTTSGSKNTQNIVLEALELPALRTDNPEDWGVDQVAFWLDAIGFGGPVADNFKAQEITGDILLELTQESLKELDVNTFGKRFKIYNAITALRGASSPQQPSQRSQCSDSSDVSERHLDTSPPAQSSVPLLPTSASKPDLSRSLKPRSYPDDDLVSDFGSAIRDSHESVRVVSPNNDARKISSEAPLPGNVGLRHEPASEDQRQPVRPHGIPRVAPSPPDLSQQFSRPVSEWAHRSSPAVPLQNDVPRSTPVSPVKQRYNFGRNSFLPNNKPQAVLPVASHTSMDSIAQRMGLSDANITPDIEGWLHKQGDKYKKWNRRWFVLKGPNLFYFKSAKDVRMKGIINLRGYRVMADESIYPGKYCFKAQHDRERTFFFYTDSEESVRAWVNALIKATITRDFAAPVMSSSTVPTISLDAARLLKPRPPSIILEKDRPFSPIDSRPFSLTYDEPPQPIMRMSMSDVASSQGPSRASSQVPSPRTPMNQRESSRTVSTLPSSDDSSSSPRLDSGFNSHHGSRPQFRSDFPDFEEDEELIDPYRPDTADANPSSTLHRLPEETRLGWDSQPWQAKDYVDWINRIVEHHVNNLGELRTGQTLVELLEALSGKELRKPTASSGSMFMLDSIVSVFKFMGREGVVVDGRYTIKDVFTGNESKIMEMLESIKVWSDSLETSRGKKKASGGTFGEEENNLNAFGD